MRFPFPAATEFFWVEGLAAKCALGGARHVVDGFPMLLGSEVFEDWWNLVEKRLRLSHFSGTLASRTDTM